MLFKEVPTKVDFPAQERELLKFWEECNAFRKLTHIHVLAAPMHPLCQVDCPGLCARCGKDLNEGPCQCPAEAPATAIRVIRSTKH